MANNIPADDADQVAPNMQSADILKLLKDAINSLEAHGESALRIALSDDLLSNAEDWYKIGSDALSVEIRNALFNTLTSRPLLQALSRYPYAVKIIWFRIAYEEYRGDNYQKAFADHLGFPLAQNRSQLMAFAGNRPFKFDNKQHYLPSNGYILTSDIMSVKYLLGLLRSSLLHLYFGFIGVMTTGGACTLKAATKSKLCPSLPHHPRIKSQSSRSLTRFLQRRRRMRRQKRQSGRRRSTKSIQSL